VDEMSKLIVEVDAAPSSRVKAKIERFICSPLLALAISPKAQGPCAKKWE
jgi:hypothetical protein